MLILVLLLLLCDGEEDTKTPGRCGCRSAAELEDSTSPELKGAEGHCRVACCEWCEGDSSSSSHWLLLVVGMEEEDMIIVFGRQRP